VTQLAVKEMALAPVQQSDPALAMIERFAADPNFDVSKLQALMDMRERELTRIAEQEFNVAFARMQPRIPIIDEHAKTNMGTYAPREDIVEVVRPILAEFGFSLSFRTEWPEAKIQIVGILTHEGGHSRESVFLTDSDKSGSKNDVQARGSAVEYGRRYTTTDLLNIATRKADDDGKKAGKSVAPEGFDKWIKHLETTSLSGLKALGAAWECSDVAFTKHIKVVEWEDLKKKAKAADAAPVKAVKDA